MRTRFGLLAAACALTAAGTANAQLSLTFNKATACPGSTVRVEFGDYFTSTNKTVYVYLVRASILGEVLRPAHGGGTDREGPPQNRAGVHRVGRTLSGKAALTFRVPVTRPGRFAAVLWCPACRSSYLLSTYQGSIPDDASVRRARTLLRVLARA